MIVLDTHIWIWWVQGDPRLPAHIRDAIQDNETTGIGVCPISCWEIAMAVARSRLDLGRPAAAWFAAALRYPGMILLDLTPAIALDSVNLPLPFHRDPADRLIVATARAQNCPVATVDRLIVPYPHVQHV